MRLAEQVLMRKQPKTVSYSWLFHVKKSLLMFDFWTVVAPTICLDHDLHLRNLMSPKNQR